MAHYSIKRARKRSGEKTEKAMVRKEGFMANLGRGRNQIKKQKEEKIK